MFIWYLASLFYTLAKRFLNSSLEPKLSFHFFSNHPTPTLTNNPRYFSLVLITYPFLSSHPIRFVPVFVPPTFHLSPFWQTCSPFRNSSTPSFSTAIHTHSLIHTDRLSSDHLALALIDCASVILPIDRGCGRHSRPFPSLRPPSVPLLPRQMFYGVPFVSRPAFTVPLPSLFLVCI